MISPSTSQESEHRKDEIHFRNSPTAPKTSLRTNEKEHEKLQQEKADYNKQLFDRILRSYYQAYTSITSQLKELMGKDYAQYIAVNAIEFPTIPSENQMRTRMQQPEDVKIKIAPAEADNDYRRIQQILAEAAH